MTAFTIAPVRERVQVSAPLQVAFDAFVARLGSWWPAQFHIGAAPFVDAVIEPRVGGRWFERDADRQECDWGQVLAWEPPHRVLLSWSITPDFQPEPDLARASEIEVRFTAVEDGLTLVELEHRHFERHGAGGQQIRSSVGSPGGWAGILALFAAAAPAEVSG